MLIRNLQGDGNLSSAFALEAGGESNRMSSNSSFEVPHDASQVPFDNESRSVVLLDKTEGTITQRSRSTGIIEIRSPMLENVLTMPRLLRIEERSRSTNDGVTAVGVTTKRIYRLTESNWSQPDCKRFTGRSFLDFDNQDSTTLN